MTANDGVLGERYLDDFRDNEKITPAILTTSHKLSTGVDARNVRNIVLMHRVNNLFDVLEYIDPITREERVAKAQSKIFTPLNKKQKEFLEFVLSKYIESGVEELAQDKLPDLLQLKFQTLADAQEELGSTDEIKTVFLQFQRHLYQVSSPSL